MSYLMMEGVSKLFGKTWACNDITLSLEKGRVLALLGPSGCGKSTTLRTLAGFERPDSGEIRLDGRTISSATQFVPPERRGMGVVFQSYALWPHMTLLKQVAFGLTMRGVKAGTAADRAREALKLVHLDGLEGRYPHELSGGQQQRVALARAIVIEPQLILLDEPLSNLDSRLREDMRFELRRLQQSLGQTMVYVTHDKAEALSLADEVAVLNAGRVEQVGSPEEVYRQPRTRFVAEALGSANFVPARIVSLGDGHVRLRMFGDYEIDVTRPDWLARSGDSLVNSMATVSIRSTDVEVSATAGAHGRPRGIVKERLFAGDHYDYVIDAEGVEAPLKASTRGSAALRAGEKVSVSLDEERVSILEQGDGQVSANNGGSVTSPSYCESSDSTMSESADRFVEPGQGGGTRTADE